MADRDKATIRAAAVLTASFVDSTTIDTRGTVEAVDWLIVCGTAGSLTDITARVGYTLDADGGAWYPLQVEEVASGGGVGTLYDYEPTMGSPTNGAVLQFTTPARGLGMKLQIKGTGPTGSSVTAYALRRG